MAGDGPMLARDYFADMEEHFVKTTVTDPVQWCMAFTPPHPRHNPVATSCLCGAVTFPAEETEVR